MCLNVAAPYGPPRSVGSLILGSSQWTFLHRSLERYTKCNVFSVFIVIIEANNKESEEIMRSYYEINK